MNATEIAAWWGAVMATVVFAWDIYKWGTRGASVELGISSNMESFNYSSAMSGKTYIFIEAKNLGDAPTTITHLACIHYTTILSFLRKKQSKSLIIGNPGITKLPYVLKPGELWQGLIEQTTELEDMSRNGLLYSYVYHSTSKKPVRRRVIIENLAG